MELDAKFSVPRWVETGPFRRTRSQERFFAAAFREAGAKIDIGRAYLVAARIARLRQDEDASQLAERARQIFSENGARLLLREAEEFLAGATTP
jgi:nanoRNase/pAp phosphatase (c-di-AMP/oligoRNAs hydrolase)